MFKQFLLWLDAQDLAWMWRSAGYKTRVVRGCYGTNAAYTVTARQGLHVKIMVVR